jgi:putative transposase
MSGISNSQVSRLCEEIDVKVKAFRERLLKVTGHTSRRDLPQSPAWWSHCLRCRHHCRRRQKRRAARGAGYGSRHVRGRADLDGVPAQAGAPRTTGCEARGLRCHKGPTAAVTKVLSITWQRCRVHLMRNVLAHAGKSGRRVVSAFMATAFAQETPETASAQWRSVADQIRPKVPKLATIMDDVKEIPRRNNVRMRLPDRRRRRGRNRFACFKRARVAIRQEEGMLATMFRAPLRIYRKVW